jgi:hypothetical protein
MDKEKARARAPSNFDQPPLSDHSTLFEKFREQLHANWREEFKKHGLDPEQCTCLRCADNQSCRHAFAGYNYNGDCLADQ